MGTLEGRVTPVSWGLLNVTSVLQTHERGAQERGGRWRGCLQEQPEAQRGSMCSPSSMPLTTQYQTFRIRPLMIIQLLCSGQWTVL